MLKAAVNLLLAKWSKEGEGHPGPGRRTRGDGGSESTWGRATARGPELPALVGPRYTGKPQTDVSRAGKYDSENGYYKNRASSCFPWASTPNVLHSSSVVIKAQQSH